MKRHIKNILKPYARSYQKFVQNNSYIKSKRPMLAENSESEFDKFLDILIYYMCVRCSPDIDNTYPKSPEWIGPHHNGLFSISLGRKNIGDLYMGIMNSYRVYLEYKENPVDIEVPLAKAFFDIPMQSIPADNLHRTLKYFFLNRHNNFIRHGLEDLEKSQFNVGQSFPPNFSMHEESLSIDGVSFAVELDRAPFTRCFAHDNYSTWYYCGGVMSLMDFKKLGGRLSLSGDRDHFYAKSDIELSNWYFLYRTQAERTKSLGFPVDLMRRSILDIKASGAGHIEINTLTKFFKAVNMLEQRIEAFEVLSD